MLVDPLTADGQRNGGWTADGRCRRDTAKTILNGQRFAFRKQRLMRLKHYDRARNTRRKLCDGFPPRQTAQCILKMPQRPGAVFRRQHQNHMIRVIKLRIDAVFLQNFGDLCPGIAERLRTQGDLQRLVSGQSIPVACNPLYQCLFLRQKSLQCSTKRCHAIVGCVQRLQNQIGGAAGAKQGHGRLCLLCQGRRCVVGNMQIRAAGNHRQRFMR